MQISILVLIAEITTRGTARQRTGSECGCWPLKELPGARGRWEVEHKG